MTLVAEPGLVRAEAETQPPRGAATARTSARKVLGSIGSLLFMLLVNFFLFRVLPGDPARSLGRGRLTTDAQRRGVQQDLRADRAAARSSS